MRLIAPHHRPHCAPTERLSILELRAARAWSARQTADAFLVTAATIANWMKRIDEEGSDALLQDREPVNRFPDFVRRAVQRVVSKYPIALAAVPQSAVRRRRFDLCPAEFGRTVRAGTSGDGLHDHLVMQSLMQLSGGSIVASHRAVPGTPRSPQGNRFHRADR